MGLCIANTLSDIWLWWDYLGEFICDRKCGSCLRKFWNEDFLFIDIQESGRKVQNKNNHFSFQLQLYLAESHSFLILQVFIPEGRLPFKCSKSSHICVRFFKREHLCFFSLTPSVQVTPVSSKSFFLDFVGYPQLSEMWHSGLPPCLAFTMGWDRCESLRPSPLVRCSLPLSERHESHAGALEIPHLCPCCWQESQSAHESRNEIIKSRLAYQPSWPITDLYLNWKGSILGRQGSSWPPEPWCSARATAVQRLIPGQWTPCHAWEGSSSAQHHTSCQKGKGRELE